MDEEEIKSFLERTNDLGTRLTGEDKETFAWVVYGYNQCAKLLKEIEEKAEEQQKEFIKYLEKPIELIKQGNPTNISEYTSGKLETLEESLQKYKEIIGYDK